ncbi:MAG: CHASE domain-containing protein [Bacteriovoracaceae bacterium]|nr:CHASE domain-containing protein [Bacteriovoracaceae bacterium]
MQKKISSNFVLMFFIFVLGSALWSIIVLKMRNTINEQLHAVERKSFENATLILQEKVESYVHGLQGMGGFMMASQYHPSLKSARNYAEFRHFFTNFPGALGYGFIRPVKSEKLNFYLSEIKKQKPSFNYRKLNGSHEESFVIEIIEPIENNSTAQGLDVATEPRRLAAALAARDTGKPVLTAPIELVQASGKGFGFLYFLPIYDVPHVPETLEEKRKHFVGWSYAPILSSIVMDYLKERTDLRLSFNLDDVSDQNKVTPILEMIAHDDENKTIHKKDILIGGRVWRLVGLVNNQTSPLLINTMTFVSQFLGIIFFGAFLRYSYRLQMKNNSAKERIDKIESWQTAVLNGTNYSMIATKPDGVITIFNKAAEQMLGYKKEEMIDKLTPAVFHDLNEVVEHTKSVSFELGRELTPGFETFVAKTNATNLPDTNEWTYIRKDGSRFPVRLSVTGIRNPEGEILGYLGVAEDISEIKKLSTLVESQRMTIVHSAKMSALGEMAGGVAHEINNPLAIIASRVAMLLIKIEKGDIPKTQLIEDLNKIDNTVFRIGKIIKGLRTFSRESSSDPMQEISIQQVISDTLDLCREKFNKNNVEIRLEGDMLARVKCRSVQISQVLMNLLSNSYDAILDKESKWVNINVESHDGFLKIRVTDSGTGIDEKTVLGMMNPFFTTKEVGKGTGLGLSISKGIIEAHSGAFYYNKNSPNTQFIIELPV